MEKNYKQILSQIDTLIFDVDGVLTDGNITITTDGQLLRTMNVKDGYALKTAIDHDFLVCIISGGSNEGARKRLEGLGVKEIHLGVKNKIEVLNSVLVKYNKSLQDCLYMGDDIPDYHVMQKVLLPCCPQNAVPEIKNISKYVSHKNGGNGAVRDIIEQFLKIKNLWNLDSYAQYD